MPDRRVPFSPDASDQVGPGRFKRAIETVERGYSDRWPARGKAGSRTAEWRPLEDVSREGRQVPYRKWPNAKD